MKKCARGTVTVEFAIIAAALFIVLFAVIELARIIWVWNTADEATRRGARVAAVCPINSTVVPDVTIFSDPENPSDSPILLGLTTGDVSVSYLEGDGTTETTNLQAIRYVRVAIIDYEITPLIPFVDTTFTLPPFSTTLPSESLGFIPGTDPPVCSCYGIASPCEP